MNHPPLPRLPGDRIVLALSVASTLALPVLRVLDVPSVVRWWVPILEIVLVLRAIFPIRPWSAARGHLVAALLLCLGGDVLIDWTPWGPGCIVLFAGTHLNLLWIFVRLRRPEVRDLFRLVPWVAASSGVLLATWSRLPSVWMVPGEAAYLLLLDLVAWRGLALRASPHPAGASLLAAGAVLFWATDHLVVLQAFRPDDAWVAATWICYPPALLLLAGSSRFLSGMARPAGEARAAD